MATRKLVYVDIVAIHYGFQADEANSNTYGGDTIWKHQDPIGTAGVFFEANDPKPYRATKRVSGAAGANPKIVSSYCDETKVTTLKNDGWSIKGFSTRGIGSPPSTTPVYVTTVYGFDYGFYLRNTITAGEKTALGIVDASTHANPEKIVWGAFPKPFRAYKQVGNSSKATFMSHDAINTAIADGWAILG